MKILTLLLLMLSATAQAKFYKVAVIDTGLNLKDPRLSGVLCPGNHHWNFVNDNNDLTDYNGHGTHIAGLIKQFSGKKHNYCLNIYKYYDDRASSSENAERYVKALIKSVTDGSNLINISGGGPELIRGELEVIKSHPEVKFVVAAGNDGRKITRSYVSSYRYYPASYNLKNVVVVGNRGLYCRRVISSNFGPRVDAWEMGENVISTVPRGLASMTGTSQATAIHTGRIISNDPDKSCLFLKP